MLLNMRGQTKLFNDRDLKKVNDAVFNTLESVGMVVEDDHLLSILEQQGARVDKTDKRVKFSSQMIEGIIEYQRSCPDQREKERRNPEFSLEMGLTVDPYYYDFDKQQRRRARREDFINLIKFGEALNVSSVSSPVVICDVNPEVEAIEALTLLLRYSRKPGKVYPYNAEQFKYVAQIGEIYAGDKTRFIGGGIFVTSPLKICKRAAQFMLKMAEYGLDCSVGSMPISGGNAPVTLAGNVVVSASEILGGWITERSIKPDAKLSGSVLTGVVDMRTGVASFAAPEAILQDIGVCEVFRKLYGGHVWPTDSEQYIDAKIPGIQAVFEKVYKAITVRAACNIPVHRWHDIGQLRGNTFSPVEFLLDKEFMEALWRLNQGIRVDEDTIALEAIRQVGLKKKASFLDHKHTLKHFRQAIWYPNFLDRSEYGNDPEEIKKEKELLKKMHNQFENSLSSYKPPEIDSKILEEIEKIKNLAYEELV